MKTGRVSLDPFAVIALLVIGVCTHIFISVYFGHAFSTFTTEEEIEQAIQTEFGILANYL